MTVCCTIKHSNQYELILKLLVPESELSILDKNIVFFLTEIDCITPRLCFTEIFAFISIHFCLTANFAYTPQVGSSTKVGPNTSIREGATCPAFFRVLLEVCCITPLTPTEYFKRRIISIGFFNCLDILYVRLYSSLVV